MIFQEVPNVSTHSPEMLMLERWKEELSMKKDVDQNDLVIAQDVVGKYIQQQKKTIKDLEENIRLINEIKFDQYKEIGRLDDEIHKLKLDWCEKANTVKHLLDEMHKIPQWIRKLFGVELLIDDTTETD